MLPINTDNFLHLHAPERKAESSTSIEWPKTCSQFTLHEIQLATRNFDESLVIGRGGFGKVYKGTIVNGASPVVAAIKRLESTSKQGAVEFWAEVEMLTKLRHCHLVSLLGYCNDGREMILVYEYMPHGTLEDHLHKFTVPLSWMMRLKICIGAARGLDYLHTGAGTSHAVIHRDVKSSNILLNESWAAKISDFGLSKIGPTNRPSTYVNTLVKGTFGYLDPEYFYTGRLTRKSDVYAFGVVLFENLCRKRAVGGSLDEKQWGLARWAQDSIKEGRLKLIVDSNIRGQISPKCLKKFARLAECCLHSDPKQRPTMAQVVATLESILALQEKTNNTTHPGGMTIFGRRVPMFLFPSNDVEKAPPPIPPKGGRCEEVINNDIIRSLDLSPFHDATGITTVSSDGDSFLESLELDFDIDGGISRKLHRFDFVTISIFSEATQFGKFYLGRLQNGQEIAMKKYLDDINPIAQRRSINNELYLAKLEHQNLVRLLGYCVEGTTMLLVYEFAHYQSLDSMIFDPVKRKLLDWNKRYNIILGVARVLLYLHKHAPIRIIHGNVHSGNILLDQSLDPKLSNLEFATRLPLVDSCTQVRGTWGYVAPDYFSSTKVDVFSFGVLVLETISGQRFCRDVYLNVKKNWSEGTTSKIIDPTIDDVDPSVVTRMIQIGFVCVEEDPKGRPTMDEVVVMLTASSLTLPLRKHPAFMTPDTPPEMLESEEYDSGAADEFISELHPR